MKLTEAKLKALIVEAMEEEREFDFSGRIDKNMDYEGLRGVIELLLDSEGVEYEVKATGSAGWSTRTYYEFHEPSQKTHMDMDYYWYQPFDALVDALNKAGIPNQDKMRLMTRITTPSFRTITHGLGRRTVAIYDNS